MIDLPTSQVILVSMELTANTINSYMGMIFSLLHLK